MQTALLRAIEAQVKTGTVTKPKPPSTFFLEVRNKLLPPPIHWGRSARWIASEIDAVVAARISGASNDQIRALVEKLVSDRKNKAPTEMAAVCGGVR